MQGVRSGPAGPDIVAEAAGALRAPAAAGHQVLEQRLDAGELGARRCIVREVGAEEKGVRHVADLRLLRVATPVVKMLSLAGIDAQRPGRYPGGSPDAAPYRVAEPEVEPEV